MKPKHLLLALLTLAILAALYLLANSQNLGGLFFRTPIAFNIITPIFTSVLIMISAVESRQE